MDKGAMVLDKSQWRGDSTASTSKSFGLVHINSIAIEISGAAEESESPAVHEHFSIRGYVSGMRTRDLNACLPFSSEGDSGPVMDDLPPLYVPRFRWWQCSNCVPDSVIERSNVEMAVGGRSDGGTSSCADYSVENIGNKHGSRGNGVTEASTPSDNNMSSRLCSIEPQNATPRIKDGIEVRDRHPRAEANPVQIREGQKNTGDASRVVPVAERLSCRVDEPDNASSGSDGTLNALPHRRRPKLRSLADIMVEEKNPPIENLRTKSASSCGLQATSTEMEVDLGPELQSNSPADLAFPESAKGTRSPQRKRKFNLEDDRGLSGMMYPYAAGKRSRGIVIDTERTGRGGEVSDSESEGDASVRLDLRLGTKTAQMKPKKSKPFDIGKKTKTAHIDINGSVPFGEFPKVNSTCSADTQRNAVPADISFGKMGYAPSPLGEMGSYFRNFISGQQQTERLIPSMSKGKRPEVEADQDTLMAAPSKSILRDCSTKGKVTLDLSLNSFMDAERSSNSQSSSRQNRGIPDLNETFTQKTAVMRGKQLPTFSEKRSLPPLHKSLDISASCSNEAAREAKRQSATTERQNRENNNIEMEIVELLAKNQRDRALGNSRNTLLPEGVRGTPAPYVDRQPGMFNFPAPNRRSGLTVGNGNTDARQNVPMNFPQLNKCQSDMGRAEGSQFRLFGPFTPSQPRKTQYPASSSIMFGPRRVEGTELFWPPRAENSPFHLSVPQNNSVQNSFSDQCHKGKAINDIRSGEAKKAASLLKEGRIGPSTTSVGNLDNYPNDTIPAMQLLSLMDRGIVSGSSFKVGPKSFLDKPFSPCTHHPRTGKENQSFLGRSFFAQGGKDFPDSRYSVFCSGESSKKASSHAHGEIYQEQRNRNYVQVERNNNIIRSEPALGECVLNRNPADFSIPDASNEFTISAKDLKPKRKNAPRGRKPRFSNVDIQRSQKVRRDAMGKEPYRK